MGKGRAKRLAAAREVGTVEILALARNGYDVQELTPYQFRINDALDLYPTQRRFHNLKTQRRGRYYSALVIVQHQL